MDKEPDFYAYRGDGNQKVLDVIRACRKLKTITIDDGRTMLLVKLDPPVSQGVLSREAKMDVVGLTGRSTTIHLEEFGVVPMAGAVVWEVREVGEGRYAPLSSVGMVVVWKDKPELVPD